MIRKLCGCLLSCAILTASCCLIAWGDATTARSAGRERRDDGGGNRPGELDRELFAPGDADRARQPAQPSADDLPQRLRRELGNAATVEEDRPLLAIAEQMRKAASLIGRADSGTSTQALQAQIVADLDRLLAQARQAAQRQSAGGTPQPASAARTPAAAMPQPKAASSQPDQKPAATRTGHGNAKGSKPSDPARVRDLIEKVWGTLPPRQREQVQQIPAEQFLPKYRPLIEEYFRRLSEEQGSGRESHDR